MDNPFSQRRKRGTGLTERTNVTLSPHALELKRLNKLNLSAMCEKIIIERYGEKMDPLRNRMINKLEELREQRNALDEEMRVLASSIAARDTLMKEDEEKKIPKEYPDLNSTESQNQIFKNELKNQEKDEEKQIQADQEFLEKEWRE